MLSIHETTQLENSLSLMAEEWIVTRDGIVEARRRAVGGLGLYQHH